jgi:hypothetical protein
VGISPRRARLGRAFVPPTTNVQVQVPAPHDMMEPVNPRSRPGSTRDGRPRLGSAAGAAVATACAVIPVLRGGAVTLGTNGLARVSVTSYQALPPPYRPAHTVLSSAASLRSFAHALHVDHIGTTSRPTSSSACSGGIQYTVVMSYRSGRRTSLDAYSCGGTVTGNMTGNVARFVTYLASIAS